MITVNIIAEARNALPPRGKRNNSASVINQPNAHKHKYRTAPHRHGQCMAVVTVRSLHYTF